MLLTPCEIGWVTTYFFNFIRFVFIVSTADLSFKYIHIFKTVELKFVGYSHWYCPICPLWDCRVYTWRLTVRITSLIRADSFSCFFRQLTWLAVACHCQGPLLSLEKMHFWQPFLLFFLPVMLFYNCLDAACDDATREKSGILERKKEKNG